MQHLTVIEGDLSRYESSDDGRFDKPIEADSDANVRETEDMTDAELVARLEAVRAQNDAKFAECIASNSELGSDIRAGIADMGAKIEGAKAEMTGEFSKAVAVLSSLAAETKVLSESARDRPTNFQMWKSNVAVAAAALALLLAILAFAGDRFDGGMSASGFQTQSAVSAEQLKAHIKDHDELKKSTNGIGN